jgi:hypothetical protein
MAAEDEALIPMRRQLLQDCPIADDVALLLRAKAAAKAKQGLSQVAARVRRIRLSPCGMVIVDCDQGQNPDAEVRIDT